MSEIMQILKIEGVMAQGYGLNPKIVMRDRRLTPEAKCIYSYIASFAGAGSHAFPSRNLMLEELGMSVNRYYKHLKLLLQYDYIRIEKTKTEGNLFGNNVYTIVNLPDPETKSKEEKLQYKPQQTTEKAPVPENIQEKVSPVYLKEQIGIELLKSQLPESIGLLDMVWMVVEDMVQADQINIAGTIRKRNAINSILSKLTPDHIRCVVYNYSNTKSKIKNKKAYLQACILNSILDIQDFDLGLYEKAKEKNNRQKLMQEEQERENNVAKIIKELHEKYPEFKKIDQEIISLNIAINKAALSNNDIKKQSYQKDLSAKRIERENLLGKISKVETVYSK